MLWALRVGPTLKDCLDLGIDLLPAREGQLIVAFGRRLVCRRLDVGHRLQDRLQVHLHVLKKWGSALICGFRINGRTDMYTHSVLRLNIQRVYR